jgi:Isochorismatase family
MNIHKNDTAVLVTDPQNDFLSEQGVAWPLVGDSVKDNNTIANIEQLFKAAKNNGFEIFISPHYYYPTDRSLVEVRRHRRADDAWDQFEVTVVRDATAGPRHPELGDGYTSALVNFGFIANAVRSTDEVVKAMG